MEPPFFIIVDGEFFWVASEAELCSELEAHDVRTGGYTVIDAAGRRIELIVTVKPHFDGTEWVEIGAVTEPSEAARQEVMRRMNQALAELSTGEPVICEAASHEEAVRRYTLLVRRGR